MSHSTFSTGSAAELFAEYRARLTSGDRARASELLHPDFGIEQPASLPHGGWHKGLDGMDKMVAIIAQHWERTIGKPRAFDCGPDTFVQMMTVTWTAKATGRSATIDVVEFISVSDGKVLSIRIFPQDTNQVLGTLQDS